MGCKLKCLSHLCLGQYRHRRSVKVSSGFRNCQQDALFVLLVNPDEAQRVTKDTFMP